MCPRLTVHCPSWMLWSPYILGFADYSYLGLTLYTGFFLADEVPMGIAGKIPDILQMVL